MENHHEPCSPNSLKQKLRSSLCIIPCFPTPKAHHHRALTAPPTPHEADNVSLVQTSSFSPNPRSSRSRHHHHPQHHYNHHHHHNNHYEFAELKDKCRNWIGRMHGRGNGHGRAGRRHHSADFKYDALSYALNFDHEESNLEDDPLLGFSSRLPHSQPRTSQDSVASPPASKEITAYS
ncbi:histidine-rich glycoprotein-like [Pyrus x bretschneideri]|uniref:histidine-rich glycoprotein-like n=1 Tax=Pyrus x bretschneideri TaxID=225117 RepID=UPI0020307FCB|nr:histidine-rich glycoprotein-like [Pyrus x bretschneideri]